MNILHIDSGKSWRGGQNQLRLLLDGLNKEGIRSIVACPPHTPHTSRFNCHQKTEVSFRGTGIIRSAKKLLQLISRESIHLIHAHSSQAHSLSMLLQFAGCRLPIVVHRRVMFPPGKGLLSGLKYSPGRVSHYIAVSQAIKNTLICSGQDESNITVIHSGLSLSSPVDAADRTKASQRLKAGLGLSASSRTAGFCGALTPEKGCEDLIRGFNRLASVLPDLHLIVAGCGSEEDALRDLARGLGLEKRVHFLGFVSDTDSLLKSLDCLVLPSHSEGLGTTLLQAALQNCPVIGTNTGGIPEIILHEKTGLLVPVADPRALADAVCRYFATPSLMEACRNSLAEHVRENFSVSHMVHRHTDLYKRLCPDLLS